MHESMTARQRQPASDCADQGDSSLNGAVEFAAPFQPFRKSRVSMSLNFHEFIVVRRIDWLLVLASQLL